MVYHELARYFENQPDVNFDRMYAELEIMLYGAAKKLGIKLRDPKRVLDLRSDLFLHLWELPKNIPINQKWIVVFSKSKRLVYSASDSGSEKEIESDCLDTLFPEERAVVEEDFYSDLSYQAAERLKSIFIHPRIKSFLIYLIRRNKNDLMDYLTSPTLVGNLLKALLVSERFFSLYNDHDYGEVSGMEYIAGEFRFLKDREKEVFLGCVLLKAGKWAIFDYILMGDMFFVHTLLSLEQRTPHYRRENMQNLLHNVRVYCFMEGHKKTGVSHLTACHVGAKRFGIRFRDAQKRYSKIRRLLTEHEQFTRKCIIALREDVDRIEAQHRLNHCKPVTKRPHQLPGSSNGGSAQS